MKPNDQAHPMTAPQQTLELPERLAGQSLRVQRFVRHCSACNGGWEIGTGDPCKVCKGHCVVVEGGAEIRSEINRRHWEEDKPSKDALLETLTALSAWGIAVEEVEHEGVKLAAIPTAVLPITNLCNYCHFKGSACWERENPLLCYNDSRPDGIGVVFAKMPNRSKSGNQASARRLTITPNGSPLARVACTAGFSGEPPQNYDPQQNMGNAH